MLPSPGYCRPILFATVFLFSGMLSSQSLPEGKYHRNRERTVDIIHVKEEISFKFDEQSILATTTIQLTPLGSIGQFSLDAIGLNVLSVNVSGKNGSGEVRFRSNDSTITVFPGEVLVRGDTVSYSIAYTARPTAGMYFLPEPGGKSLYTVFTYGEGGLHANWIPIFSDVNDKFSTEMVVTVPPPYVAISNGKLVSQTRMDNGDVRYHYLQQLPHSAYLMALYVGDFERQALPPALDSIPLAYWAPRGRLPEGESVFSRTPAMVEFFSGKFRYPYPWNKYDQVAIRNFYIGAMEHTGITAHRSSVLRKGAAPENFGPPDFDHYHALWSAEGTIAHELAHHWFGNNLTCRNLSYIWLNESFATYCQMLWDEAEYGENLFALDRIEAMDRYLKYVASSHTIRPLEYHYFDAPDQMYTEEITYFKGGLVLHMLRTILGDEAFFEALAYYLRKHEFSNVISSDFEIAIEEATGRNLDWFFDDWVYGGGYPILEINSTYLSEEGKIDLSVAQIQPRVEGQGIFRLPLPVTIVTAGGKMDHVFWLEKSQQHFVIDCSQRPQMVSIDGNGSLIAEIRFHKSAEELVYQATHDDLAGQFRALRQLVKRFPGHPQTVNTLRQILSADGFWGLRAEAALLLGELGNSDAEELLSLALKARPYQVQKAGVLSLKRFRSAFAVPRLKSIIRSASHPDVVATAIIVLSEVDARGELAFIRAQLSRPAWYQEITLACLKAFQNVAEPSLVSEISPYLGNQYNDNVRVAALDAWERCSPADPVFREAVMQFAEAGSPGVRERAIQILGELRVSRAVPLLERIAEQDGNPNIKLLAKSALEDIGRLMR